MRKKYNGVHILYIIWINKKSPNKDFGVGYMYFRYPGGSNPPRGTCCDRSNEIAATLVVSNYVDMQVL